uniref:Uncharacterized protein n=1 Tax=Kalanchoe fedtschenkoi TaxID=63787 RepID=A0A7N0U517_KALFE
MQKISFYSCLKIEPDSNDMMYYSRFILIRVAFIAVCVRLASAQDGTIVLNLCSTDSYYTNGSAYGTNLKSVLALISSNNLSGYGFYNISVGQNSDKVNAIGLCRGDISLSECQSCLNFSASDLYARCPTQREAIAWYDNCMFRYSNRSIFGTLETTYHTAFSPDSPPNQDKFNQALSTLLAYLRDQASLGNSTRKFAVGYTIYTIFGRVYALAQCTPDLSGQLCGKCLDWAFKQLPDVSVKQGGRVFCESCSIRYEIDQFYKSIGDALLPPPPSNGQSTKKGSNGSVIRIAILTSASTIGFMIFIMGIILFVSKRWLRGNTGNANEIGSAKSLQFDFETVKTATENFSDDHKLGQGGFGAVYKGRLAGQLVAVKRLALGSGQGDAEFKNEVLLLTKLQHKNLVRLHGFCLEGQERLLIYEFVPNGSLDQFLFDHSKSKDLDWEKRYKIIGGIARGLLYLHEDSRHRIIHRDLKASNILLDEVMIPKIADFGLARLFPGDQTKGETSKVVGTYGYMAPEYIHGRFSVKSDVYSFGVLLLELVSGRKNTHVIVSETAEDLISFAWDSWRAGTASAMIDPALKDGPTNEIMRCIQVALLCVQESMSVRPSMAAVVAMLNSYSLSLPLPSIPAFYMQDTNESEKPMSSERSAGANSSDKSKEQSGNFSTNGISITDMYPR